MKNLNKMVLAAIVLVATATNVNAQATATASATATIVTPISIVKDVDMNFGNIAVQAANPGTVTLPPTLAAVRTKTGGVTLPAVTGTVTAAKFTVNGTSGYLYNITLPSSAVTLSDGASHTMDATSFVNSAAGTLTGGTEDFYVGATLAVAAAQTPGVYTTATPFSVTVNYN